MINIEQGQKVSGSDNLRVSSLTGSYDDNDLIQFYDVSNPSVILGAFQAQYVRYGSVVYRFNDGEELGREILKIEPESPHSSASYVRMKDDLERQLKKGSLGTESLNQVVETEKAKINEELINGEGGVVQNESPNINAENQNTSTTTPASVGSESYVPENYGSSTNSGNQPVETQLTPVENVFSTPPVSEPVQSLPIETSTTTSPFSGDVSTTTPPVFSDVPIDNTPTDPATTTVPVEDSGFVDNGASASSTSSILDSILNNETPLEQNPVQESVSTSTQAFRNLFKKKRG